MLTVLALAAFAAMMIAAGWATWMVRRHIDRRLAELWADLYAEQVTGGRMPPPPSRYGRVVAAQASRRQRKAELRKLPMIGAIVAGGISAAGWTRAHPAAASMLGVGAAALIVDALLIGRIPDGSPRAYPPPQHVITRTVTPPVTTVTVTAPSPARATSDPPRATAASSYIAPRPPVDQPVAVTITRTVTRQPPSQPTTTTPPSSSGGRTTPPIVTPPPTTTTPPHHCLLPLHLDPLARIGLLCE